VVYYSNYLIIELLRKCIDFLLSLKEEECEGSTYESVWAEIFSWQNMIKKDDQQYSFYQFEGMSFFRPVDADILSLFKKCKSIFLAKKDSAADCDCSQMLTEFYTRVYKKSLWKSFAEYTIFFSSLSENEKSRLSDLLKSKSESIVNDQYGYLNKDWTAKFENFGLKNVVWVMTDSKLKSLDPDNSYIVFKDITVNYRSVSLSHDIHLEQRVSFFYIYYNKVNDATPINIDGIKQFIHEELKTFPSA
jgi:hypothetical protein